jgi:hypothetical protein
MNVLPTQQNAMESSSKYLRPVIVVSLVVLTLVFFKYVAFGIVGAAINIINTFVMLHVVIIVFALLHDGVQYAREHK